MVQSVSKLLPAKTLGHLSSANLDWVDVTKPIGFPCGCCPSSVTRPARTVCSDYFWVASSSSALFGGNHGNGENCGVFYWNDNNPASHSTVNVSSRLTELFKKAVAVSHEDNLDALPLGKIKEKSLNRQ